MSDLKLVDLKAMPVVMAQHGCEGCWDKAILFSKLEACPDLRENQTYEDWLKEFKDKMTDAINILLDEFSIDVGIDVFKDDVINKVIDDFGNKVWHALCKKDDRIIELKREIENATRIMAQMM